MRVLCLDLGSKRIGVAASDRSGTIATPLTVINRSGSVKIDYAAVAKLVEEEEAEAIVVGLPLNMDGTEGSAAKNARIEVERLTTVVNVPVYLHDERRTTVQADKVLIDRDVKAQDRRKVVDQIAAAFILQSWLDSQHEKNRAGG